MKIFNSLSRKIEKFEPIKPGEVGMYTCGPTVYDYQHIGNLRTMTLSDLVRRALIFNDFKVKSVRNITDIDDKIIRNASERGVPIKEFSQEFTKIFFQDLDKLNILPVDVVTYATEYIFLMIKYIEDLVDKGYAYVEKDGSVYFDVRKFAPYGKLSQLDLTSLKSGTRILSDEYTKESVSDFALWKSTKTGEIQSYDSPWGKGRPGWHIECSVMSQHNLGDTFDIHVGGRDLLFPHHENEIAQSEAKTGKPFVKYWIHGEFLLVDNAKMSKSLKNFYTLKDIEERGFDPIALRYFYLTGHYRTMLNFTWESLEASQSALKKLRSKFLQFLQEEKNGREIENDYLPQFAQAINDDLNTAKSLAVLWKMVDDKGLVGGVKYELLLKFDEVLGLGLDKITINEEIGTVPKEVQDLTSQRERLRAEKKFAESDRLREKIEEMGYTVKDSPTGVKIEKA